MDFSFWLRCWVKGRKTRQGAPPRAAVQQLRSIGDRRLRSVQRAKRAAAIIWANHRGCTIFCISPCVE
ncbi:MAG: hypothetical protein VKK80_06470 [Prochlorothrix sp.]|nr:hypothetical protein [Prochlorothrix sp.]